MGTCQSCGCLQGCTFKLYPMFDIASLPCDRDEDKYFIRRLVTDYYKHSNQLRYNGLPVVATFCGQSCRFGTDHILVDDPAPVHFVPSFFIEPPIYEGLKCNNGAFSVSHVILKTLRRLKICIQVGRLTTTRLIRNTTMSICDI